MSAIDSGVLMNEHGLPLKRPPPAIVCAALLSLLACTPAAAQTGASCPGEEKITNGARPLHLQMNLVRAIALELKERGYSIAADGYFDRADFVAAITRFQREAKLPETGAIDCEIVKRILGVDLRQRLE